VLFRSLVELHPAFPLNEKPPNLSVRRLGYALLLIE
jgi:hypothetical protein